jgi:hypothetical protein
MKKIKMSIMRWLGVQDRLLQLELEIDSLESKLMSTASDVEDNGNEIEDKLSRWEAEDIARDALSDLDISEYDYGIQEIVEVWMDDNVSGYVSNAMNTELESLADNDTIRELISEEISAISTVPAHTEDEDHNPTWDMNEIIQEVIEEVITRLRG